MLSVYGSMAHLKSGESLPRSLAANDEILLGQDKGRELADVIGNPAPLAAGHHSCFVSQSQRTLSRWTKKLRLPSVTCFALQNTPSVYHPLNSPSRRAQEDLLRSRCQARRGQSVSVHCSFRSLLAYIIAPSPSLLLHVSIRFSGPFPRC